MLTIQFNNPGLGPEAECGNNRRSSGNARYEGSTPDNPTGDDWCGPMARACCEAAVDAAAEWLMDEHGLDLTDPGECRLIVVSFSNGITCATGWMQDSAYEVHAFLDLEGPVDSFEQLVCPEIVDLLGSYEETLHSSGAEDRCDRANGPAELADRWSLFRWVAGRTLPKACGGQEKFGASYDYYGRPPKELGPAVAAARAAHPMLGGWWPAEAACVGSCSKEQFEAFDPSVLASLDDFWDNRLPETQLLARKGAYVRINSRDDHVQPRHYQNRHAWRALNAALEVCEDGWSDVYWADAEYLEAASSPTAEFRDQAEPTQYLADDVVDPDDPDTFGDFPVLTAKWAVEVDLVRWAFAKEDFARGPS